MTHQPLVSVIVGAYNAGPFIEETLRSVTHQTYRALEVIVVDDGSTDGTAALVRAAQARDPRIRLMQQENQGIAAARNRAIEASRGELLAPLDGDDVWHPKKLEHQVERLQAAGAATGFTYCWWAWIDSSGHVLDRSPRWRIEGQVLQELIEVNFTGNASVPLFRRAAVEEAGGYNTGLRQQGAEGCEDWELALRVAERYAVAVVPRVLVGYRRHPHGLSASLEVMWRSQSEVMKHLATRVPDLPSEAFRRSRGQFALHLAGVAFWSGRYGRACRYALRVWPITLGLAVMPYVARVLAGRLWSGVVGRTPLARASRRFDEDELPESLIPYDRIHERRLNARHSAHGIVGGAAPVPGAGTAAANSSKLADER
jgi:glycosyltransferase involved in cell wall biosynthesis